MHPLYHLRRWLKTGLEKFKLMFDRKSPRIAVFTGASAILFWFTLIHTLFYRILPVRGEFFRAGFACIVVGVGCVDVEGD